MAASATANPIVAAIVFGFSVTLVELNVPIWFIPSISAAVRVRLKRL